MQSITLLKHYCKSVLFLLFCCVFTTFFGVILLPVALLSSDFTRRIAVLWARLILSTLKFLCGIKYEVQDAINAEILNQQNIQYIIVSKHQSAWETLFFTIYFSCPAFILKKELLYIPLFGLYLRAVGMIIIDRSSGVAAIKKIIRKILQMKNDKRAVVIFPEGTRVLPKQRVKFQQGIIAITKSIPDYAIIPVALNSGLYWSKDKLLKKEGTIKVKFLSPIYKDNIYLYGDVLKHLETVINEESDALL